MTHEADEMMDSEKLALICRDLAENKKAENTIILDVRGLSSITDFFVLTSGNNEPHLRAIKEEIQEKLKEDLHLRPGHTDGRRQTAWVVLDYYDVIIHIMRNDVREHYDLEGFWGDAPRIGNGHNLPLNQGASSA